MTNRSTSYGTEDLLAELAGVVPFDAKESQAIEETVRFLHAASHPFERGNLSGHITGSGFLLSPDLKSVLLTHHAALDRWLQFGGHADGEANIRLVALRETQEESGKADIDLFSAASFDVDVHEIPENPRKNEPRHLHYDIRYLLLAQSLDFTVSHESKDLRWVSLEEILEGPAFADLHRMAIKGRRLTSLP